MVDSCGPQFDLCLSFSVINAGKWKENRLNVSEFLVKIARVSNIVAVATSDGFDDCNVKCDYDVTRRREMYGGLWAPTSNIIAFERRLLNLGHAKQYHCFWSQIILNGETKAQFPNHPSVSKEAGSGWLGTPRPNYTC